MDDVSAPLHVVVLPWLAFGHLLPFLELSKGLARRGHRVSFLSTPRNLQRLPKIPPTLSRLVTLVDLPFPLAIPLPPGAEATSDIPPADNEHLMAAYDALEAPFAAFLDSASPRPDWVIHDFIAHWVPPIARPRCLPCAVFTVLFPTTMAFCGTPSQSLGNVPGIGRLWKKPEDLTVPPPWTTATPFAVAFRLHEARDIFSIFRENASGVSMAFRMGSTLDAARIVVVRSCPELDGDWIRLLAELYNKPVLPAGFLPPRVQEGAGAKTAATSPDVDVFEWLDRQAPSSVLYVALGSEVALSVDLYHELALGLELSRLPFLWALRRPAGLPLDLELLPEGFEARTGGRGLVAGWVPQTEVLEHRTIGGVLTHCGPSSLVEALRYGLPLALLPLFMDQGLNSRVMAARGLGREVPRREEDGVFTKEGVAETVRFVVVDEAGEGLRAAARGAVELFGNDMLMEKHVEGLAQYLADHRV